MKTITVKTLGLTGPQWIERLEKNKYRIGSYAKEILNSPDFKPCESGEQIEIAFISVKDMDKSLATTQEIKAYAKSKGYGNAYPEIALLVREAISDEEMEKMGFWYIASLHDPIKDSDGLPSVLRAYRSDGGRWVDACWDFPDDQWNTSGAFAFPVLASSPKTSDMRTNALDIQSLALRIEALEAWRERCQQP